jgi:flavin-dependent dehydrogenase
MDSCDVLIVGGGPAGSACATKLRSSGRNVVVMDKAAFPRDKVCAGWITPAVLDELQLDPREYASGRVLQPITGFLTGTIGGATVRTDYGHVVSYGIRRCEFDDYLLKRSGAKLRLSEPLQSARRVAGEWVVNDSLRARWLIGAGGHFCPVARQFAAHMSNPADAPPVILAQEVELEMTAAQQAHCEVAGTHPELYFCRDLKGYGWVFRKGHVLNIGLGREHESRLSEHVAAFCDSLHVRGRIRCELPTRFHGHAYRLRTRVPQVSEPGVLLIGDAAGLASTHSGEGIRPAIESGLLAASAILASDDPEAVSAQYHARLQARLGLEPTRCWSDLLPPSARSLIGRLLLTNHWFTRHVVLDRWFLDRRQPALSL